MNIFPFINESYHCPKCDIAVSDSTALPMWKCFECDTPVVIKAEDGNGKRRTIIRIPAWSVREGQIVVVRSNGLADAYEVIATHRNEDGSGYLALKGYTRFPYRPTDFVECVQGTW